MDTLTFRNKIQEALFTCELSGQLSDGYWENTKPFDHWKNWCNCDIKVGENVGRNFYAIKDNYNFNNRGLLEVVGDRMLNVCNLIENGYSLEASDEFNYYDPNNNYRGEYWDKIRIQFTETFGTVDNYKNALIGSYTLKELRKELKDMKNIVRTKV